MYTIQVLDASGKIKKSAYGPDYARFLYHGAYEEGDCIAFFSEVQHCVVQVDQAIAETMVYLPGRQIHYRVPKGDLTLAYPPQAFAGDRHIMQIRPATKGELSARRNLAFNPIDQRYCESCFPHASANVETRDEPVFFARNVIDGMKFNHSHGNWPFHSWGIGGRSDAQITIHFGRAVCIDEIAVTLRADFPHDSWWKQGTMTFSDGQQMTLTFEKTGDTQSFPVPQCLVEWVRLSDLKKAKDLSPFPALTELEVFGQDI